MQRIEFGKYIVADPNICHGVLTFKGTRLFVQDVIEMVADGMDWDTIIAEAVRLAGKALVEDAHMNVIDEIRFASSLHSEHLVYAVNIPLPKS